MEVLFVLAGLAVAAAIDSVNRAIAILNVLSREISPP
jgi:hypothetical protein